MSETNEAKEPGQVACEIMSTRWRAFGAWPHIDAEMRAAWADTERELRERLAAPLDVEARDLHRQLSELRVEAQAQRAGRVEAEHQRDVLVGRVGREVTAALVAAVPAKVADVLTGAQRIDEAMQKALNDAMARAERAELEIYALRKKLEASEARAEKAEHDCEVAKRAREEERQRKIDMLAERNAARKERDEARAEVERLTKAAEDAEDAVTGRLDAAFKDGASRMQAEIAELTQERASAKAAHDAWRARAERAEERVARLTEKVIHLEAHLNPRPDVGLAGMAAREAGGPPATAAEPVRPPAPDLRRGDKVRLMAQYGARTWTIAGAPEWRIEARTWVVPVDAGGLIYATSIDLSTRERTWQRGEVVPHAPPEIARKCSFAEAIRGFTHEHYATLPLAEPWTQKGV